MSYYVIGKLEEALDLRAAKSLGASRVLIVGVAYKKNVADIRESPSFKLIELLEKRGTKTDFYDPYVHEIGKTREHLPLRGRKSVQLDARVIASYDAIVIATDHDCIDYGLLADYAKLIVDTRNICARLGLASDNVVKA